MTFERPSFRPLVPSSGAIILLILMAGCITLKDPFSAESRIKRYLAKNPDRPDPIKTALLDQTLCKGMTPEEVKLCWGAPSRREPIETDGVRGELWSYVEHREGGTSSDHGSDLFDYSIPLGQTVFTTVAGNLVLAEWTIYDGQEKAKSDVSNSKLSTGTAKQTTAAKPAFEAPSITPNVDLSRWPALRVAGIIKGGKKDVALINDSMVGSGETVEGVTVVAVGPTEVYLRYGAETICLSKGQKTHDASARRKILK